MSSSLKNVALIGASGNIGKIILEGLVQAGSFNITIVARASSTATFPASAVIRRSDFSEADLALAFQGQDAVISAVGAGAFLEQKTYINAAIAASVTRFIPSEFSSNTLAPGVLKLFPLFEQKKAVLEYLQAKEHTGLTWTSITTGLLSDAPFGLSDGFLGYEIASRAATVWDVGTRRFTLSSAAQLAAAVVATLNRPAATANKALFVASIQTSQNELLAALESRTGQKWSVTRTTTEAEVSDGQERLGKGDFSGAHALVRATSFADLPDLRADFVSEEDLSNGLLGLEMETVEQTVERVLKSKE